MAPVHREVQEVQAVVAHRAVRVAPARLVVPADRAHRVVREVQAVVARRAAREAPARLVIPAARARRVVRDHRIRKRIMASIFQNAP